MVEGEREADDGRPVVGDQAYAVDAELVEQAEYVLGQLPPVVAVRGRVGPAGAAEVGTITR